MTPPPITAIRSGRVELRVAWSEVTIVVRRRRRSRGSRVGAEPGRDDHRSGRDLLGRPPRSTPEGSMVPRPRITSTLRRLRSPDRPPTRLIDDSGRALGDAVPVRREGGRPARRHDPELGGVVRGSVHLRRVQQRLGGDAAAVQAGAAERVVLHQGHAQSRRGAVQRRARIHRVHRRPRRRRTRSCLRHPAQRGSTTSAVCGTTASSRAGLVGVGVFLAAIRTTG